MDVKPPLQSKTLWAGAGVTLLSAAAILAEVWALFDYEQRAFIDTMFGPQFTMLIGIGMIVLRVITIKPVGSP